VEEEVFIEEDEIEEIDFEFWEDECRERLCITDTCGYDIMTSVTQSCINSHFRCLWKASQISGGCISQWAYKDHFEANFGAIQIQLPFGPASNTVIVYITLRDGQFNLLDCFRNYVE
jgi:hypothetical protein